MKTSMIKLLAAVAVFAIPAVAHASFFQDLNYTSIIYGDHVGYGYTDSSYVSPDRGFVIAHNDGAYGFADGYGSSSDGDVVITTDMSQQWGTLTGKINISIWDDFYEASGTSAGMLIGSFSLARYSYPSGSQMLLNMSATPNLIWGQMPEYENFYFKLYDKNGLLTELNANKMVDTIYVTTGETINFQMYALLDDTIANASRTRRDFEFTATPGGPVAVPAPGAMLLGSLGIGAVSILRKRIQRA